ncbi:AEC family transporter [Marinimicrobium sp. C6131]|uniref:AEC family transporter n=1 Tax=Marinimicrobium sp. C6131 TaxID=3022676 RepID=UPI00223E3783|nr:AEC family transporter [Marinimicrobium sp. C6131]UZJ44844.1 AEC family transporter [Marinimicrobium sp. C6131]
MDSTNLLSTFLFSLSVTTPIFLMVILGATLRRIGMIDETFINTASRLVFAVGLPVLLFFSSATTDFGATADGRILFAVVAGAVIIFLLSLLTADGFVRDRRDRGVLAQAAFRGNLVIIGLAYCANAYGESGVAMAALPIAITIVLYNVLSVIALNRDLDSRRGMRGVFSGVVRNPLIIGIVAGLFYGWIQGPMPEPAQRAGRYLGEMSLPLALLCVGGALDLKSLRQVGGGALAATTWKLIVSPLVGVLLALALGLDGQALAVVFLLAASPTATASFVMVRAMGGNASLAATMIVQSTVFGLVTVTLGLWVLQALTA